LTVRSTEDDQRRGTGGLGVLGLDGEGAGAALDQGHPIRDEAGGVGGLAAAVPGGDVDRGDTPSLTVPEPVKVIGAHWVPIV
jgi:hypothetical protein